MSSGGPLSNIPPSAWDKLVTTACDTFTQCVAPITATTAGLGRLIEEWFDAQSESRKMLASEVMASATHKASRDSKKKGRPNARQIVAALEVASCETDDQLRHLWSNLLAQELSGGEVHPTFVHILGQLTAVDAARLAFFAAQGNRTPQTMKASLLERALISSGFLSVTEFADFSDEHLASLRLIERVHGLWNLTATGRAFIDAVSDPSDEHATAAGG